MTKPIIFTSPPLPASRHVILNGLSDPWAGFEPLENMVSQMKLSQETACVRQPGFSGAPHLSPIKSAVTGIYNILISRKQRGGEKKKKNTSFLAFYLKRNSVMTDSFVL